MANTIDIRSLNTIFNHYLTAGNRGESFDDFCHRLNYFTGNNANIEFRDNIKHTKNVNTSMIANAPDKYKSYLESILYFAYNGDQLTNEKAITRTIRNIVEQTALNNQSLGFSESESKDIYERYLKDSNHKMKKMAPKRAFAWKKFGIPTIVTAAVCAAVGGIIAASGLVAGALPFLTDSLLLNVTSLGIMGAFVGAIVTPITIVLKNKLTRYHYAHKYGTKTDNLNRILNSDLSKLADIENLNLPINELFKKFKKTEEKIRNSQNSKNPFVRLANRYREKTNRNRLHEIINVLRETNGLIKSTDDTSAKEKLKAFQKYLVNRTKNLEVSRRYADILVRSRFDKKDKRRIANLKASHKDSLEELYIDALGRNKDVDEPIVFENERPTTNSPKKLPKQSENVRERNRNLLRPDRTIPNAEGGYVRNVSNPTPSISHLGQARGNATIEDMEEIAQIRDIITSNKPIKNSTGTYIKKPNNSEPSNTLLANTFGDKTLEEMEERNRIRKSLTSNQTPKTQDSYIRVKKAADESPSPTKLAKAAGNKTISDMAKQKEQNQEVQPNSSTNNSNSIVHSNKTNRNYGRIMRNTEFNETITRNTTKPDEKTAPSDNTGDKKVAPKKEEKQKPTKNDAPKKTTPKTPEKKKVEDTKSETRSNSSDTKKNTTKNTTKNTVKKSEPKQEKKTESKKTAPKKTDEDKLIEDIDKVIDDKKKPSKSGTESKKGKDDVKKVLDGIDSDKKNNGKNLVNSTRTRTRKTTSTNPESKTKITRKGSKVIIEVEDAVSENVTVRDE